MSLTVRPAAAPEPDAMPCPICHKPTDPAHRPFCSRRCADIDLARWLNGSYVIPGPPLDEAEETPPALSPMPPERPH